MTHTTIANGATGLAVRNILNGELAELLSLPAGQAVSVADEAARLAIPAEYLSAGKLVYQEDTKALWRYTGTVWALAEVNAGPIASNTSVSAPLIDGDTGKFGNVGAGNYSEFEADGTLKYNGTATVYRDINLSGGSLTPAGAAAPDQINFIDANLQAYAFDGGVLTERLYGSLEMQHDYKEGSDIEIHVHWTPTDTTGGNVVWQIYYSWANVGDTYATPTLIAASPTAAGTVAWANKYTSVGVISGAGKTINSQLSFQIFRDPANVGDTYTGDAALVQFGVHYQCDTTGSRTNMAK